MFRFNKNKSLLKCLKRGFSSSNVDVKDKVRLAKFIAAHNVASRRAAERLISDGHVKVNNNIVDEVVTFVDPKNDVVYVQGKKVKKKKKKLKIKNYKSFHLFHFNNIIFFLNNLYRNKIS